jgi:hypothetical protein
MVDKAEIRQLTAVRGVAAMLVVMHHFKKEFGTTINLDSHTQSRRAEQHPSWGRDAQPVSLHADLARHRMPDDGKVIRHHLAILFHRIGRLEYVDAAVAV